jgi:non-ribosomal peptide synthetase component F
VQQCEHADLEDASNSVKYLMTRAGVESGGPELVLLVLIDQHHLHISAAYQTSLFQQQTIEFFVDVFRRILNLTPVEPHVALSKLSLTTRSDLQQLVTWNPRENHESTFIGYSIGDRFRESAKCKGSAVAIVDGSWSISYEELDEMTDRLASWLHAKNLGEERIIGIVSFAALLEKLGLTFMIQFMGRSALIVIAYLGCLKAGLAYMPLDTTLPFERLKLMVQSTNSPMVLTASECPLSVVVQECILLSPDCEIIRSTPIIPLPKVGGRRLSNVLFTSGSTGVPKGVMLEHRGMVNLCAPETSQWPDELKSGFTVGVGFDPSGQQIFSALLTGSELHVLPDNRVFDAEGYRQWMIRSGKSLLHHCHNNRSHIIPLLSRCGKGVCYNAINPRRSS